MAEQKSVMQQTIDAVKNGHVFAVIMEEDGAYYQSVFPAPMAEHSQLHTSKEDGWEYIVEIISIYMQEKDNGNT